MIRAGWMTLAALGLAACDSGGVPPPGQEQLRAGTPHVADDEVVLRGQGLVAGPEAFYFAAGRSEVEAALQPILGEPVEISENAECGTGTMQFTEYTGGFIVNFQRGNLVGWNTSDKFGATRVVGEVQIGTPRAEAQNADGFFAIEDSTLGDEFALGNAMGGFFEDDEVVMLYAGAQCFSR
ncbi:MAG: aspartate-semialdehyde dehydrogenase [Erythrobacter sp.]|uniref:aspartate-semialdehyde dehydrogenase n=1 Tax=Erythrobacter sp. TaxID=1042 RepID=UPI0026141373|nr:aspartate-semialdehyde dehydrogenase [Erythrobacter sp.]MDJ0977962.1 aspartate-semialdehyde dehydrogenase [Erythrobacter sp.]